MSNTYDTSQNPRRLAIGAIAGIVLIVIGVVAFNSITRQGKVAIEVVAVPRDAKITIDGSSSGNGTVYVTPGKHTFKAQKSGFSSISKETIVGQDDTVTLILSPVSEEAIAYARKNERLYLQAEAAAGEQANKAGEEFEKKNPLIAALPYKSVLFNIEYARDDKRADGVIVKISAETAENRTFAIDYIRSIGHEPSDYKISANGVTTIPRVGTNATK